METRGEGHVKTDADAGVMGYKPKIAEDCQGAQMLEEERQGPSLEPLESVWPC